MKIEVKAKFVMNAGSKNTAYYELVRKVGREWHPCKIDGHFSGPSVTLYKREAAERIVERLNTKEVV